MRPVRTVLSAGETALYRRPCRCRASIIRFGFRGEFLGVTFSQHINEGIGVQISQISITARCPRFIEFVGDGLNYDMYKSYEALFCFAYGVGKGFSATEYSL
ncbi:hypothetical protein B0I35DRAFT_512577 [Stachybotrys elegans]|uniref:Uncharacterized protein n=1 Tax=Stachybotrys elegans TaxID=80388 RepID=A0A8K0SUM3_9HYPO|nr:hypothetical protein B0I35DRAFT_512577 [Stachybotrys elegans]